MTTTGATPTQAFAKIVTSYHEQYGEAGPSSVRLDSPLPSDVVLDEEGGMINKLLRSLEETILARRATTNWETVDDEMTTEEQECLKAEHRTWQLIRAILENRISREGTEAPSALDQLVQNPYMPPEDLIQTIVNEDPELSLYVTLLDHLHTRPLLTSPPPLEARHGYIPSTIRRAKAQQLSGPGGITPPSLDPDFTLRDPHGQALAGEDQTYQGPLLETLWDLVRHGELDQAVKACEEGGEPWRAASMMGGRRWTMGGMTVDSPRGPLKGNRTRALWKKACRAIAKNPTLSPAERRLYAALIPDLPTLLPACTTWEDHLWAHVLARVETRLEQRLKELGGFWWNEEMLLGRDDGEEVPGGLDEIFALIIENGSIEARNESSQAYAVAQRMIILGRSVALLDQFVEHIPRLHDEYSSQVVSALVRFYAHLVLVLRSLGQPVPDYAANTIIEFYLAILQQEGDNALVAMYAACLREGNAEESYARHLRSLDFSLTKEAKMEALHRAKQHHLDVAVIARETVRMILEDFFATLPPLSVDEPDIASLAAGLNERDVVLIRSIEWLTMVPETAADALAQSNAVARYFLALGQAGAAQALLKTLPEGIAQAQDDTDLNVSEHEDYQALFAVFAAHDAVDDVLARAPKSTASKVEQHSWRKTLLASIDRTETRTITLLTADWLRFDIAPSPRPTPRQAELARVRQIFIPDLVLRLHSLLVAHHAHSTDLVQRALDLTKVVAAEDNHVYEEFLGIGSNPYRLKAYLGKIREASLLSLRGGGTPFQVAQ